jgi:arylsulfatase A-like enzyme
MIFSCIACKKKESDYKDVVVVEKTKPNVLWIIVEDLSTDLSCYGDNTISTKNIDQLAAQGILYTNAYSTSPYGAPSRAAIFTGTYPHLIGLQHTSTFGKKQSIIPPAEIKIFSEFLRADGYYCSLRGNTQVPFSEAFTTWDNISSEKDGNTYRAAWENCPTDKPFFSTIYLSQTREYHNLPKTAMGKVLAEKYPDLPQADIDSFSNEIYNSEEYKNIKLDLSKIKTPDYLPKTRTVKDDFAKMYLNIKRLDNEVGNILKQLQTDKLDENTIIFFFSENGRGMPGGKRWLYDDGIKVPLIIKIPGITPAGEKSDQLISLIDLAPTLMVNLDIRVPEYMRGKVFIGKRQNEPREYIFAARDRIDDANEKLRSIASKQFKYIKNYTYEIPFEEKVEILPEFPTLKVMDNIKVNKQLEKSTDKFIKRKAKEELYDIKNDPYELHNLAERDYFTDDLNKMRLDFESIENSIGGFLNTTEEEMHIAIDPDENTLLTTDVPDILPEGGRFKQPVEISITCNTSGASIAYAILPDGETDIYWELYNEPITIDNNCTVLSKAIRYGFEESAIKSISYTFEADIIQ